MGLMASLNTEINALLLLNPEDLENLNQIQYETPEKLSTPPKFLWALNFYR